MHIDVLNQTQSNNVNEMSTSVLDRYDIVKKVKSGA